MCFVLLNLLIRDNIDILGHIRRYHDKRKSRDYLYSCFYKDPTDDEFMQKCESIICIYVHICMYLLHKSLYLK